MAGYLKLNLPNSVKGKSKQERAIKDRKGFYSSDRWRQLRAEIIAKHPTCEICKDKPSKIVHHKQSREDNPECELIKNNLMAVCWGCHNKITKGK